MTHPDTLEFLARGHLADLDREAERRSLVLTPGSAGISPGVERTPARRSDTLSWLAQRLPSPLEALPRWARLARVRV